MKVWGQQDIVWVRFPYSDLKESKFRPGVIVSCNNYNKNHADVIVCAITSKLDEREWGVFIDASNISSGKMPLKSRIRADKIMHIEKTLIAGVLARVDNKTFDGLVQEIMKLVRRAWAFICRIRRLGNAFLTRFRVFIL